jgi:glycosyltransferase involved in cell wall biosynthesis
MSEPAGGPRVLLVCEWFVKYTAGLASGLLNAGCEVTMLTRDHGHEFGDDPASMREFVAAALDGRGEHLELTGRVSDPAALRRLGGLRRRIAHGRPDVVHAQESISNDLRLVFAAGMPWHRYALTVHDPTPHPGERQAARWRSPGQGLLRRRASLVFAHSRVLAEETRATGDVRAPIEVVPHGFDAVAAPPPPSRPSLLFFGRLTHYKGVDTLLDAMPAIWAAAPETRLVIAGDGDLDPHPLLADPRVELRREHVAEEEVPGLFGAATVVVLPYRQASQSGVGSLAKQYRRALVVTDVGGLPELVAPDFGRLVPPEDPGALAAAVIEVVGTPGLAAAMGEAAAASAAEAGWDRVGAMTLDAYRRHLLAT